MADQSEGNQNNRGFWSGMIVGGAAAVVALIFALQNTGSGTVQFLAWEFTMRTWLWALLLFVLGFVSGYFFHWSRVRARR